MARHTGSAGDAEERLLLAAGRGFRAGGFGGIGVDGLAKDAGLTSGAFYAHFKSKADAFEAVVKLGLTQLRDAVIELRATQGTGWLEAFIDFYMGERRLADLAASCALQSLTGDVARASPAVRRIYQDELDGVLDAMTGGDPAKRARSIALLALISGGVGMARAVDDPAAGEAIATSVRAAALSLANGWVTGGA